MCQKPTSATPFLPKSAKFVKLIHKTFQEHFSFDFLQQWIPLDE
jgi:hypothetical protein